MRVFQNYLSTLRDSKSIEIYPFNSFFFSSLSNFLGYVMFTFVINIIFGSLYRRNYYHKPINHVQLFLFFLIFYFSLFFQIHFYNYILQVDQAALRDGLIIAGYYLANENISDFRYMEQKKKKTRFSFLFFSLLIRWYFN